MIGMFILCVICPLLIIATMGVYIKDMIQEIIRRFKGVVK